jgi:probable rRNA maturation factor
MRVNIQIATQNNEVPELGHIVKWAEHALQRHASEAEMTVRVVDIDEGRRLNELWRKGTGATNVLAFPIDASEVAPQLLGDVVVCASLANAEAQRDGKSSNAHWAHLVIHGTLHLLGYDHVEEVGAAEMERVERTLLADLSYPDPYL